MAPPLKQNLSSYYTRISAGGIIHLQRGHPVLAPLLLELATSFDGRIYQANGPPMVTRVLRRFCGVSAAAAATPSASARRPLKEDATMLDPDRCMGIRVLPPDAFYPITWKNWHWLFDKGRQMEKQLCTERC
jgi:lactosylceramide 4-alpha-galactosyltransferase